MDTLHAAGESVIKIKSEEVEEVFGTVKKTKQDLQRFFILYILFSRVCRQRNKPQEIRDVNNNNKSGWQ